MDSIKGLPYSTAEFDKEGRPVQEPTIPAGITDLIVVSHGWNNDREAAESLYRKLFENFVDVTENDPVIAARKLAIVGVIWPSKKFDPPDGAPAGNNRADGAASIGDGAAANEQAALHAAIDQAAPLFDDEGDAERLKTLHDLLPRLDGDTQAQAEFVETLRALLDPSDAAKEQAAKEDGENVFFGGQPKVIFEDASKVRPQRAAGARDAVAGEGQAAGLRSLFSKVGNAVTGLLNLTTYFEMKKRAGKVGELGLAPLIDRLAGKVERVHLVGHSFGGRLVTAAAKHSSTSKLHSMSLLQAAFSHSGFSRKQGGFFSEVVERRRITGPIVVTHTKNDTAVGRAYPIASRLAGDNAAGIGDADDPFGAIGSNGALHLEPELIVAETDELLPVGGAYAWQRGRFHNLEATRFIVNPKGGDAHSFVFVPEVSWAISRAVVS